jgi:hypothetical protein
MTKERTSNDQMLALSLSQRDERKALLIQRCPLFRIATEGHEAESLNARLIREMKGTK